MNKVLEKNWFRIIISILYAINAIVFGLFTDILFNYQVAEKWGNWPESFWIITSTILFAIFMTILMVFCYIQAKKIIMLKIPITKKQITDLAIFSISGFTILIFLLISEDLGDRPKWTFVISLFITYVFGEITTRVIEKNKVKNNDNIK